MKYSIFMIDPPWKKQKGGIRKTHPNQNRYIGYETMETSAIFSLLDKDVFSLAEDVHTVFMWCIDSYLIDCEREMIQRGYKRHCRFIWDKTNGVAPAFTIRYSHEYLIWYYKPKMITIDTKQQGKFKTVFSEKSREHSRKPDFAYDMVNSFYPNENKIDVFSREKREGWDQYGNQLNYF